MNRRLLLLIIGLLVLSATVLCLVAFVLPQHHVYGLWPLTLPGAEAAPTRPAMLPRLLAIPSDLRGRSGVFWLRPFGLYRDGASAVWWYLGSFASMFVLAVLVLLAMPRRVGILTGVMSRGWGQLLLAFAIGLMGYLVLALLLFLIFINLVGWPMLLVLGLLVYVATGLGLVAVSVALGASVCRLCRLPDRKPLFQLGVGGILLFLGSIVPYLGWLVAGVAAATGFGAVLWTRGGDTTGWSLEGLQGSQDE